LLRCLVQADNRNVRIARPLVDFQHIFHSSYECGVGVWRDHPLFLKETPENVFL
jgi:hypothetical protein